MIVQARRSLKASPEGIYRANKAVLIFATKIDFAAELEISRATVQNFFAGKPVGRENFHKICQKLELPWREIADLPEEPEVAAAHQDNQSSWDLEALVQEVRHKGSASIQQKCGMMRVLDMSQPIGLNDIYTDVNVLEKISGRRRLEVADLLKVSVADEFERPGLGRIAQERVSGLEAVKKYANLIVLGKPGAGKTTFLKHVAIQCSLGTLQANKVPIFITLKDFAETEHSPSLLEYIKGEFAGYGVSDPTVAEQIFGHGQALVLLDGLDEVRETDCYRVMHEVRNFSQKYHLNHFVLTCRIATREYTLEQFTEVEVADFDRVQIANFATKWFSLKDPAKSSTFIQKLQQHRPIQELATNPLLLTLLCLMFEESADFPSNRSELYKEGLNVLLRKWDAKRNIEREQVYKKLSVQHKEDLLGQIALMTFQRGDYFFRQKELEQHIADYIRNLPGISTQTEALQLDSEAVLKSIEAQHGLLVERARGIYSFSHLTFHEYFAAKEIVASSDPQALETALKQLTSRITNKRWREVFLLSVGMLGNADYLLQLMKQQIDLLLAQDKHLQAFLNWLSQKCCTVSTPYKRVTVRAFYLDLTLSRDLILVSGVLDLTRTLDPTLALARNFTCDFALDHALDRVLALALADAFEPKLVLKNVLEHIRDPAHALAPELDGTVQQLQEQLPDADKDRKVFQAWWIANGQAWTERLRAVMISHRNIGHDWEFTKQQQDKLRQYCDTNKLLVDCLNSDCYVTRAVREEIEETLLLWSREIEARKRSAIEEFV